jgi:hypothetical protein
MPVVGNGDVGNQSRLAVVQAQAGLLAVGQAQAVAHVIQACAAAIRLGDGAHADAAILYADPHGAVDRLRRHRDLAAAQGRLDAVLDRVLDEGQQDHGGQLHLFQRARQLQAETQALAQAHLHHLQVGIDQAEFGAQADLLAAHVAHAGAQEVDQVTGQFGGARRTVLGQLLYRAQGVEQEVRLDLGAQQAQLGFGEFARQPSLLGFALQLRIHGFVLAVAQDADDEDRCHDGEGADQHTAHEMRDPLHRVGQRLACHPHRQRGRGHGGEHGKAQHRQQHLQFLP